MYGFSVKLSLWDWGDGDDNHLTLMLILDRKIIAKMNIKHIAI